MATYGEDYDLERWTDGARDSDSGNLIWHSTIPSNDTWERVTMVTLNFDPNGEGDFRNYHISPDEPLDVWDPDSTDPYHYDLDDLADNALATLEQSG